MVLALLSQLAKAVGVVSVQSFVDAPGGKSTRKKDANLIRRSTMALANTAVKSSQHTAIIIGDTARENAISRHVFGLDYIHF